MIVVTTGFGLARNGSDVLEFKKKYPPSNRSVRASPPIMMNRCFAVILVTILQVLGVNFAFLYTSPAKVSILGNHTNGGPFVSLDATDIQWIRWITAVH